MSHMSILSLKQVYDLVTFFGFLSIILVASILQTSTGFGFSIMKTHFLLMLFDSREAIQINLILSLVILSVLIYKIKNNDDWKIIQHLIIGSIVGLPIGIYIFLSLDMTFLKLGVSILIIIFTLLLTLNFRIKQMRLWDIVVGSLSGLFTTSIGMPGPPLLLYFSGTNTAKAKLRGTTLTFYLFIYFASLLFQMSFAGTSKEIWISSLQALPIVLVGLLVGQHLFQWINQRQFRILTYILLFISGCYLFIQQF